MGARVDGEKWKELCNAVTEQMEAFTKPFVTPLIHELDGSEALIGSGAYIDFSDGKVGGATLLTCEHVARHQPQQHRPDGAKKLILVSGEVFSDTDCDASTTKISENTWQAQVLQSQRVVMSKFSTTHAPAKAELLFFHGLAGENAYVGFGGLDDIMTGYCSQEKADSGDDEIFEILWQPLEAQVTEGTSVDEKERLRYDDPKGFSGSLVWNTRFVELGADLSRWRPTDAVVTGLLRRWDTSTKTLLVWRVEHVLAWLASRPGWA
ncbi:MAG: hypothetical protein DCF16_17475 [Alphaproteobacteria bacterium]|nr:MAG: hypothetical protein DCF16_17475 [Alphaproteobacteria bacterium]